MKYLFELFQHCLIISIHVYQNSERKFFNFDRFPISDGIVSKKLLPMYISIDIFGHHFLKTYLRMYEEKENLGFLTSQSQLGWLINRWNPNL